MPDFDAKSTARNIEEIAGRSLKQNLNESEDEHRLIQEIHSLTDDQLKEVNDQMRWDAWKPDGLPSCELSIDEYGHHLKFNAAVLGPVDIKWNSEEVDVYLDNSDYPNNDNGSFRRDRKYPERYQAGTFDTEGNPEFQRGYKQRDEKTGEETGWIIFN